MPSMLPSPRIPKIPQPGPTWAIRLHYPLSFLQATERLFSARLAPEAPLIRLASSPGAEQHPLGSTAGAGTETVGKVKMTSLHLNDIVCLDCSHKCLLFLSASRIHSRLSCCVVYSRFISCSRHSLLYHLSLHAFANCGTSKRFSSGYLKLSFSEGLFCTYSTSEKLCRICVSLTNLPRFESSRLYT